MTVHYFETPSLSSDPLEVIEFVAAQSHIKAGRIDEQELQLTIGGLWRDIPLWFSWQPDRRMLQLGAALELKMREDKAADIYHLMALANARMLMGHFSLWSEDQGIVYRNSTILPGGAEFEAIQAEILIKGAADAFERFYPAFNYVLWGDKAPEEALEYSLFEVAGCA